MTVHSLQSLVNEGYAPSVRWLAEGIKHGKVPGRQIGRYWKNWLMTDADLERFLAGAQPELAQAEVVQPEHEVDTPTNLIMAGLSERTARRLGRAS